MKIIFYFFLYLLSPPLWGDQSSKEIPPTPVKVGVQLLDQGREGELLTINFANHPHWHTYWKNPGDAGIPIQVQLTAQGKNVPLKALEWPVPGRFIEEGNITAYGYEGSYSLFFAFGAQQRQNKNLNLSVKWLVCKNICIPGKIDLPLKFRGKQLHSPSATLEQIEEKILRKRLADLPGPIPWPREMEMELEKEKSDLALYYKIGKGNPSPHRNIMTPFPHPLISFKKEKILQDQEGRIYGQMSLDWDGEYKEPKVPLPVNGRFSSPLSLSFIYTDPVSGKTGIIEKKFATFSLKGIKQSSYKKLTPFIPPSSKEKKPPPPDEEKSIWPYLLFAFLGGLILNVMPCVLPVISLKLFALFNVRHRGHGAIAKHNLVYTLGVLTTFTILGVSVAALKYSGENVGWGFHLQSPHFIICMMIILLILSLNLFGLFEFKTPGGTILGDFRPRRGLSGDFLSGVLATLLSTPCTAPFLGTALTFAFLSSTATLFLVFIFIGLGLSFPFILTIFFPHLVHLLPRPGNWMEHFKKFLGLTLILSIVWLADVLGSLVNTGHISMKMNGAIVLLFFAFYLRKYITQKKRWQILAFTLPVAIIAHIIFRPLSWHSKDENKFSNNQSKTILNWEKWSEEKMDEYKEQKETVFISFTADWCLTCKVNESMFINTSGFREIVKQYQLKLLQGDLTRSDEKILNFLRRNGLVGIPAYFIQKSDGTLINLRETISLGKIRNNLQKKEKEFL